MGLECGGIKGLVGVGRDARGGLRDNIGVDIGGIKWGLGVGKEESQLISKFADCPFS